MGRDVACVSCRVKIIKRFIYVFAYLVLLLSSFVQAQERKLRVGYSAVSGSMAWVWTAKEAGYFDRQGVPVDLIYIGGTTQLFQSLLAGEIAFGVGGGPAIIHVNPQRQSVVGIAGTLNRMVMKIMAAPEILKPSDLRGKKVAITRYGSVTDFSARLFLKRWGLSEQDVPILQVGSVPNVLASLQNGTSQAAALSPPAHLQAERLGFKELMDLSKEEIYYPYTYVVTPVDRLDRNSQTIAPLLRAAVEGTHRFKTDGPFAKKVLAKYLQLKDETILEETHQMFARLYEEVPILRREGLTSLAQILAEKEPKVQTVNLESLVDDRFVHELEKSGFISKLYR